MNMHAAQTKNQMSISIARFGSILRKIDVWIFKLACMRLMPTLYATDHARISKQQNSTNAYTDFLPIKGPTRRMHGRIERCYHFVSAVSQC
jgi:hypothetical protein